VPLRRTPLVPIGGRTQPVVERRRWPVRALVVAVAVLAAATTVFALATFAPEASPIEPPALANVVVERTIERVSTRFGENLMTFDYRTLEPDFARLRRDTTPDFNRRYQSALAATLPEFQARVARNQTVSTSDIKGVDITSRDDDTATVLVLVSQTVRSAVQPLPKTSFLALEITVVKNGVGWKVDNVGNAANPNT
jgi:hypothetical protein